MKAPLYDLTGKKTKDLELPVSVFSVKATPDLIAQVVRVYQDRLHQKTSKVKTRSEINLTKAKWFRQKGTGRARHGAQSAPIFVGGGVAHGPKGVAPAPKKLNQKMRRRALLALLSTKANDKAISIVSSFEKLEPKTKTLDQLLEKINQKQNALIITSSRQSNLLRAAKNLPYVTLSPVSTLNSLKLLSVKHLIFDQAALDSFSPKKAAPKKTSTKTASKTAQKSTTKTK